MLDNDNKIWALGDNTNGALGFMDTKFKPSPIMNSNFEDKRIIDFSCGDGFSVIIAEVFEFDND